MQIPDSSTLVFTGDSITSGARDFSLNGESFRDVAYGSGYVLLVKALLDAVYPEKRIRIINTGIGGNTIRDLAERWERDVVERQPDWLSVKIGINDVWRQFDSPLRTDQHVSPSEFQETYRRLLSPLRPRLKGLVLCSPYVIDIQAADPMRQRMDEYREICRGLAEEFDAVYVDTQKPFDDHLQHFHATSLGWDRIHPNTSGHMLIARAWLKAVGFEWKEDV